MSPCDWLGLTAPLKSDLSDSALAEREICVGVVDPIDVPTSAPTVASQKDDKELENLSQVCPYFAQNIL